MSIGYNNRYFIGHKTNQTRAWFSRPLHRFTTIFTARRYA